MRLSLAALCAVAAATFSSAAAAPALRCRRRPPCCGLSDTHGDLPGHFYSVTLGSNLASSLSFPSTKGVSATPDGKQRRTAVAVKKDASATADKKDSTKAGKKDAAASVAADKKQTSTPTAKKPTKSKPHAAPTRRKEMLTELSKRVAARKARRAKRMEAKVQRLKNLKSPLEKAKGGAKKDVAKKDEEKKDVNKKETTKEITKADALKKTTDKKDAAGITEARKTRRRKTQSRRALQGRSRRRRALTRRLETRRTRPNWRRSKTRSRRVPQKRKRARRSDQEGIGQERWTRSREAHQSKVIGVHEVVLGTKFWRWGSLRRELFGVGLRFISFLFVFASLLAFLPFTMTFVFSAQHEAATRFLPTNRPRQIAPSSWQRGGMGETREEASERTATPPPVVTEAPLLSDGLGGNVEEHPILGKFKTRPESRSVRVQSTLRPLLKSAVRLRSAAGASAIKNHTRSAVLPHLEKSSHVSDRTARGPGRRSRLDRPPKQLRSQRLHHRRQWGRTGTTLRTIDQLVCRDPSRNGRLEQATETGLSGRHVGKAGPRRRIAFTAQDFSSGQAHERGPTAATPGNAVEALCRCGSVGLEIGVGRVIAAGSQRGEGTACCGEAHDVGVREIRGGDVVDEYGMGKTEKRWRRLERLAATGCR
ncbi:hypothetical protein DFJ73DRAFT_758929 [Zopfochytrium polystomum]|nr:hypothetical protein DFJ73DRAFT_758929 [Zopfochytrium polystomum]